MTPFHLVGHNDQNEVKHDFFSHVMLSVLPLVIVTNLSHDTEGIVNGTTLLGQDDLNKVKHHFSGHVMPMFASADAIINSTTVFISTR